MTFVGKLSVVTAYVAFALVHAIVLGVIQHFDSPKNSNSSIL